MLAGLGYLEIVDSICYLIYYNLEVYVFCMWLYVVCCLLFCMWCVGMERERKSSRPALGTSATTSVLQAISHNAVSMNTTPPRQTSHSTQSSGWSSNGNPLRSQSFPMKPSRRTSPGDCACSSSGGAICSSIMLAPGKITWHRLAGTP